MAGVSPAEDGEMPGLEVPGGKWLDGRRVPAVAKFDPIAPPVTVKSKGKIMIYRKARTLLLVCCTLFALAASAFAQTCLQEEYNTVNKQTLNCTANDVSVAQVSNVTDLNGNPLSTCIAGSTFSFIANFNIVTTANASNSGGRDNVGLYFQTDDTKPNALFGNCVDNIVAPLHNCSAAGGGICGTSGYQEFDAPPDNCGDTSSSVNPNIVDRIVVSDFLCKAPAGSTTLVLPNCTSWQVPGKAIACYSPGPYYPYETAAIPGSPSKCNCGVISLPITPVTPAVTAAKSCNTTLSTGAGLTSCDAGAEGGTVTYHVSITNAANSGDIVVDQICDSAYGNVFTATGYTGAPCAAGSTGKTITGTTCSALDIAQGSTGTCNFTAVQGELGTVTDTFTVSGHSGIDTSQKFGPTQSNSVTVVSEDAPTTATITKGWTANLHACINVRYNVDVVNTSGADESFTLTKLEDSSFGQIAPTASASILGTTCTVPQTIAVGGDYKCTFDAQICGDLTNITLPGGGSCTGFTHLNTVSGTTTLEDTGSGATYTETDHGLTLNECISATPVSQ
jgi:hypothetical protein